MTFSALSTAHSRATKRSRVWQRRRTELLQEACAAIAERKMQGMKTGRAVTEVAQKFRNRSLGDGRIFAMAPRSLRNIWESFKKRGDAAFVLRYVAGKKAEIDPLILELIVRNALLQSKSVSEILVSAGTGARKGWPSLRTIYRVLPARDIQRFLRAEKRLLAQRKASEQKLLGLNTQLRELRSVAAEKFLAKGGN